MASATTHGPVSELAAAHDGPFLTMPRYSFITGLIDRREGHWEGLTRNLERALELDPHNRLCFHNWRLATCAFSIATQMHRIDDQRVLEITPDDIGVASSIAFVDLDWRADTVPLHQFLDRLRLNVPSSGRHCRSPVFMRSGGTDWPAAEQALTALGELPCVGLT